jgi:hypothetical protein
MTAGPCALDPGWPVPASPETPFFQQMLSNIKDANFALYVQGFTARTDHRTIVQAATSRVRAELEKRYTHVIALQFHTRPKIDVMDAPDPKVDSAVQKFVADSGPLEEIVEDPNPSMEFPKEWFRTQTRRQKFLSFMKRHGRRLLGYSARQDFDYVTYADITDVRKKVESD